VIIVGLLIAGAVGALLRYRVDHLVQRWSSSTGSEFPAGILVVNMSGSFVLGVLTGSAVHHGVSASWLTVAGTGLIGAYTTFSTFTFDTVSLAENGEWGAAVLNVLVSVVCGLGAAAAGLALGALT
jgi:CrcB protein